ncbi:unnamed protein product [Closterium sp. NIES-54]
MPSLPCQSRSYLVDVREQIVFALRSYLYLFLHALIGLPVMLLFGNDTEASLLVASAAALHKATQAPSLPSLFPITSLPTFPTAVHAFYAVRLALAVLSAASEASLLVAVAAALHKATSGPFPASPPPHNLPPPHNRPPTFPTSEASLLVAVAAALYKATSAVSASSSSAGSSSSGTKEDKEKGKEEEKEKAKGEKAVPAGIGERVGVCGPPRSSSSSGGSIISSSTFDPLYKPPRFLQLFCPHPSSLPPQHLQHVCNHLGHVPCHPRPPRSSNSGGSSRRAAGVALCGPGSPSSGAARDDHWSLCEGGRVWCSHHSPRLSKWVPADRVSDKTGTHTYSSSSGGSSSRRAAGVALCGPGSPSSGAARDDHWSLCEGGRVWCSHHSPRLSKWVPADRVSDKTGTHTYSSSSGGSSSRRAAWVATLPLVLHEMICGGCVKVLWPQHSPSPSHSLSLTLPFTPSLPPSLPPTLPPSSLSLPRVSLTIQALSMCFDRLYYGQWSSSILSLIRYNVFGGGDGAGITLYGVEGRLFYLRNGLNNFTLALPSALLLLPPSLSPSLTALPPSVPTQALSLCFDRLYYGRWVSSILNLALYNVFGGGDGAGSTLYGVEGPLFYLRSGLNNFSLAFPLTLLPPSLPPLPSPWGDGAGSTLYGVEGRLFYLRNGLNNFTLALPLALLLPLLLLIACLASSPFRGQGRGERGGVERGGNGFVGWKEVVALLLLPVVIWVGFMSLQPHKEER